MKPLKIIGAGFLGVIVFLILVIFGSIWMGYVLSILWGWFVVTTFGLPPLSIPAAIGLSYVVSMFKGYNPNTKEKDEESGWIKVLKPIFALFLGPLMVLGAAWIVKQYL